MILRQLVESLPKEKMDPVEQNKLLQKIYTANQEIMQQCLNVDSIRQWLLERILKTTNPIEIKSTLGMYKQGTSKLVDHKDIKVEVAKIVDSHPDEQIELLAAYDYNGSTVKYCAEMLYNLKGKKVTVFGMHKIDADTLIDFVKKQAKKRHLKIMKVVEKNLLLLIKPAYRKSKQTNESCDLFQEMTFGLVNAVEQFNPNAGFQLSTYAYSKIDRAAQVFNLNNASIKVTYKSVKMVQDATNDIGKGEKNINPQLLKYSQANIREELKQHILMTHESQDPLENLVRFEKREIHDRLMEKLPDSTKEIYKLKVDGLFNEGVSTFKTVAQRCRQKITSEGARIKYNRAFEEMKENAKEYYL